MLSRRYGDEVCGVDALGDSAEMVQVHSIWNGSARSLVYEPVSAPVSLPEIDLGIPTWPPVSLAGEVSEPVVAGSIPASISKFPVIKLLHSAKFSMDVTCSEEGWLATSAEAKCCLTHENNTTIKSPKEGRAWQ